MKTYAKVMRMAVALVDRLQDDIITGRKRICENYGQKEIRKFADKHLHSGENDLSYQEQCNVADALHKVSSIC